MLPDRVSFRVRASLSLVALVAALGFASLFSGTRTRAVAGADEPKGETKPIRLARTGRLLPRLREAERLLTKAFPQCCQWVVAHDPARNRSSEPDLREG